MIIKGAKGIYRIAAKIKTYHSVIVLCDSHTKKFCYPICKDKFLKNTRHHCIVIKTGEQNKNIITIISVIEKLLKFKSERNALLINLGGGVVTDIGGFVASIYKRGIAYINIPTTLMAMVDASIGDKTGVNHLALKNVIGSFYKAELIVIHEEFLKTLPTRHIHNGYIEMLKYGLILDKKYWNKLIKTSIHEIRSWESLIQKAITIKLSIVAEDKHETDIRQLLNFGHTLGHALESYSMVNDKKPLLHGEAICYGMMYAVYCSKQIAGMSQKEYIAVMSYLNCCKIPYHLPDFKKLTKYLLHDKKNQNNCLQMILLRAIGKSIYKQPLHIKDAQQYYLEFVQQLYTEWS